MTKKDDYLNKGKKLIPGLTQLLSKRPDQFLPNLWPTYFQSAQNTYICDLDGNEFLDMSISGIGANVLGYCDKEVDNAVIDTISKGNSSSLNCAEDIDLAVKLCEIHPWAKKVRYSRSGGEAMSIAVRIARAYTKKEIILFCGYHGWHDWYLASNLTDENALDEHLLPKLQPLGVPKSLQGTSFPFNYNNIDELDKLIHQYKDKIAAVVMEPVRSELPKDDFLSKVKELCEINTLPLIFDEITSAFRLTAGGVHKVLNIEPDIAVFAKAMSNGYPMASIIGKEDIMSVVEESFISSTYWTERIGPTAALATINKFERERVHEHLIFIGEYMKDKWIEASNKHDIPISITGIAPMSYLRFEKDHIIRLTYLIQRMLENNILASNRFYANFCHTKEHVDRYSDVLNLIFEEINNINDLSSKLDDDLCKPGFHRYT